MSDLIVDPRGDVRDPRIVAGKVAVELDETAAAHERAGEVAEVLAEAWDVPTMQQQKRRRAQWHRAVAAAHRQVAALLRAGGVAGW